MFTEMMMSAGGGGTEYNILLDDTTAELYKASHTLANAAGKTVIGFMFTIGGGTYNPQLYDGASVSDGSEITKIDNLRTTGPNCVGTFYKIAVATNNCIISHSSSSYLKIIG